MYGPHYFGRRQFGQGWFGGNLGPVSPSDLGEILLAIRAVVVASGIYADHQAYVTLEAEPFPDTGSPFAAIHPGRHRLNEPQNTGGGTFVPGMIGDVIVTIVDRNAQDQVYRDQVATTTYGFGLLDKANAVIRNLHGLFPENVAGQLITQEELRLVAMGEPRRYNKSGEWRAIDLTFQVNWTLKLG